MMFSYINAVDHAFHPRSIVFLCVDHTGTPFPEYSVDETPWR